jgi:hypothetical protein
MDVTDLLHTTYVLTIQRSDNVAHLTTFAGQLTNKSLF